MAVRPDGSQPPPLNQAIPPSVSFESDALKLRELGLAWHHAQRSRVQNEKVFNSDEYRRLSDTEASSVYTALTLALAMEEEGARVFRDKLHELFDRSHADPKLHANDSFRELCQKAIVLHKSITRYKKEDIPVHILNLGLSVPAGTTSAANPRLPQEVSVSILTSGDELRRVSTPIATQSTVQPGASNEAISGRPVGVKATSGILQIPPASAKLSASQNPQRTVDVRTPASQGDQPRRQEKIVQPIASSGRKNTTVSNVTQPSQSLKRPAAALPKPSIFSRSQDEPPQKQQKMETAKSSGTPTGPQSQTDADVSIDEGLANNKDDPPATNVKPNGHVNVETEKKSASQQKSSQASHDRRRIMKLESELEQLQERLAGILYEQGKKYQAEMEELEGRLSRSYQLQLEGMEARLEARYQEFQTRSLKEFEAKMLATTRDANASATKSTQNDTNKGTQEGDPSQPALKRLTETIDGLVKELATHKKHVVEHSELGRKLELKLQAVTARTSDASLQRFFTDCVAESLTLIKQSQAEALEERLKRIQQELARRVDQTEISLREFCKELSHEVQEQPSVDSDTNDGDALSVNVASAVTKIIAAEVATVVGQVKLVAKEAQASLEITSKHDAEIKIISQSITSQQQTLHALKKHTSNHHSFMSGLCKTLGFQAQCGEDDSEQAFEMPLLDTIAQRLNGLEKTLEGTQGLLPLAARAKAIADEALRRGTR